MKRWFGITLLTLVVTFLVETGDGNMIDMTPDETNTGLSSHVPTEKELRTLPHIEVTSGSEWNPNTVKLGKVSMDKKR